MDELGKITISSTVIKDIIVEVLKDVENVVGVSEDEVKTKFTSLFKNDDKKSLEVEMGETECVIDLSISVVYGCKIKEVAKKVQNDIKNKVEELTGINVKEINIVIAKVVKKEDE